MGYCLGIDLGTTFVAAARSDRSRIEMVTLGDRSLVVPSVVYVGDDGGMLTGDAANRRAATSPERVARLFKRRLGDPTPMRLAGQAYSAATLLAGLLRDVVAKVSETEGEAPERVVLTHPANWGPYRRGVFEDVPRLAGIADPITITEPEAAATHYAASRRLAEGAVVAVYDLGGGTFDATVMRKVRDGVETLGTPEGVERLGGIDFDQALFDFVAYRSDGALDELDPRDPKAMVALSRLRHECVLAKEALSVDTETVLPVFLPDRHFDVRITRAEFEDLVRAQIESTIAGLTRALRSARVTPDDLSAVLLVGGSSRIPLVARMVSEELGRPILVDTHPKHAVALGAATVAALAGRPAADARPPADPRTEADTGPLRIQQPPDPAPPTTDRAAPATPPPPPPPPGTGRPRSGILSRLVLAVALGALAAAIVLVVIFVTMRLRAEGAPVATEPGRALAVTATTPVPRG